jgi:hypothetical protein
MDVLAFSLDACAPKGLSMKFMQMQRAVALALLGGLAKQQREQVGGGYGLVSWFAWSGDDFECR